MASNREYKSADDVIRTGRRLRARPWRYWELREQLRPGEVVVGVFTTPLRERVAVEVPGLERMDELEVRYTVAYYAVPTTAARPDVPHVGALAGAS